MDSAALAWVVTFDQQHSRTMSGALAGSCNACAADFSVSILPGDIETTLSSPGGNSTTMPACLVGVPER